MRPKWKEIKCPICGRKGLHYANHPHAAGFKNYDTIVCRFCGKLFDTEKLIKFIEAQKGED